MTLSDVSFRYLNDSQHCWRNKEPMACIICGQSRLGYGLIHLHEDGYDEHYVCQPCLVSGRLAERGLRVNDADLNDLQQQLRQMHPELSEEERQVIADERTTEVEQRTPRPAVLNEFTWPAHCGDYVVFFRQVDADVLNSLAPDGDGKAFLTAYLHRDYNSMDEELFLDNVWQDRLKGFLRFYLWQCSQCTNYLITYDHD